MTTNKFWKSLFESERLKLWLVQGNKEDRWKAMDVDDLFQDSVIASAKILVYQDTALFRANCCVLYHNVHQIYLLTHNLLP